MRRQRRLMNQINVVPYIDVMLVLLVIFMVTAPMLPTGTIDLPSVGKASQVKTAPLVVQINKQGELSLQDRANNTPEQRIDDVKQLVALLKTIQANNPEQAVVVAADKSVRYEKVAEILGQLQQSQISRVGLSVQTTGNK